MAPKYEYTHVVVEDGYSDTVLTEKGDDGWELTCAVIEPTSPPVERKMWFFFKRKQADE